MIWGKVDGKTPTCPGVVKEGTTVRFEFGKQRNGIFFCGLDVLTGRRSRAGEDGGRKARGTLRRGQHRDNTSSYPRVV